MAKKVQRNESNAKLVIALFIVLVAFGVFLLFYVNRDSFVGSENLGSLMTFIVIGMGLLIGLLYLVNAKSSKRRKS